MKAQELRIGNKYQLSESTLGGGICQINTPNDMVIAFQLLESGGLLPIKITEELRFKLPDSEWDFVGFGSRLIFIHKKLNPIKFEFALNSVFVYFNDEQLISEKKYLHDLQNLYFALTGEELTLQP